MINEEFYRSLNRGPCVLFIGQNYLGLESGKDLFLQEIIQKYSGMTAKGTNYRDIFQTNISEDVESTLAWMHRRSDTISIPRWLERVAKYPWNGVYTSAIDSVWTRAFKTDWRDLQGIYEEKYQPADIRNRNRLHCTYLYGCVTRSSEDERPPLKHIESVKRKRIAENLARRLKDIVTPMGILVIEGYAGDDDWFDPESLFAILDDFSPKQVYMFSVNEKLEQNEFIKILKQSKKLILCKESLASILSEGEREGVINVENQNEDDELGRRINIEGNSLQIPLDLWNQVSRSAVILDDNLLEYLPTLSKERQYQEFRRFLSESSTLPIWTGYARGFCFQREYGSQLQIEVAKRLNSKELQNSPVILHGQTGTGKTTVLGNLAYNFLKEKKYPVLFIERKPQKPINADIDRFCNWAEDNGAEACLIIWDGMTDIGSYHTLQKYLANRGRKAVVVGSYYKMEQEIAKSNNLIEAPSVLSEPEKKSFELFLGKFDYNLSEIIKKINKDEGFLVALYRILPETRSMIRVGIEREVGFAEDRIRKMISEDFVAEFKGTTLASALFKAGVINERDFLNVNNVQSLGGEDITDLQKMIGLIMVPGRFGLKVPIELLVRALGKNGLQNFNVLLNRVDLFRTFEDRNGIIFIGPRHPLEAHIVAQTRFGGAKSEIEFAKQLLSEVRDNNFSQGVEIDFAVEFVRSMGSNSTQNSYFSKYFLDLAITLRNLRLERGVINPRLMLQEANLIRESLMRNKNDDDSEINKGQLIQEAEKVLRKALDLLDDSKRNKSLKSAIMVELASVLGNKLRFNLENSIQLPEIKSTFETAKNELKKARSLSPENYYPVDVLCWITRDVLNSNILDVETRMEAEADILHSLSIIDVDEFAGDQQIEFEGRRAELGILLRNQVLAEDAFIALKERGSKAGYYLKANEIISTLSKEKVSNEEQRSAYKNAFDYLEDNRGEISNDGRCLYLLLKCWWMYKVGRPLFYQERQALPFSTEDWQYLLRLLLDLNNTEEAHWIPNITFLRGMATFHLDFTDESVQIFRDLERNYDYVYGRRRIIRSYLASEIDGSGLPRLFKGTVSWLSLDETKGEVYVDSLRRKLPFIMRDFNRTNIQLHETLEFHVAFNFRGMIADPLYFYKGMSEVR